MGKTGREGEKNKERDIRVKKCTMLLFDELGKCPFVGKGSTGEYLVYIVLINLVELSSC